MNPRRLLAEKSLLGTSIGDAFGESFFGETQKMKEAIFQCEVPDSTWEFTDDTVMSISVFNRKKTRQPVSQGIHR